MYLSHLMVDLGNNPDQPRPGRNWLNNLYHVHQRLSMAFPSANKITQDKDFLQPFQPTDFKINNQDYKFLFRVDHLSGGRSIIIVQSDIKPNWDYAFQNALFLLACQPEIKEFNPQFVIHKEYIFCLQANPTIKLNSVLNNNNQINPITNSSTPNNKYVIDKSKWTDSQKEKGKRVSIQPKNKINWLKDKEERLGFKLIGEPESISSYIFTRKGKVNQVNSFETKYFSVRYKGKLTITDLNLFNATLINGIGSAKAYGFGLLSVGKL